VSRLSGSRRGASAATKSPIGTLTNRTHSHPSVSVRMPPSSTPTAPPEPATAPHTPNARLRLELSANSVVTIDSAAGDRIAPPSPWRAGVMRADADGDDARLLMCGLGTVMLHGDAGWRRYLTVMLDGLRA
jgi:hypothetical protein